MRMEREGLAAPRSIPTRARDPDDYLRRPCDDDDIRHGIDHDCARPSFRQRSHIGKHLSSTKEMDEKYLSGPSMCIFGVHIKGRDRSFTVGISEGFFSQQNIPARAYMEQFTCDRRKGWPRHGRNGRTDVGYNAWFSWEAYTRTGGPDWRNGTGRTGVGNRGCKADLVFEVFSIHAMVFVRRHT